MLCHMIIFALKFEFPHPLASFCKLFTLDLKIFLSPSGAPLLIEDLHFSSLIYLVLVDSFDTDGTTSLTIFFDILDPLSSAFLVIFETLALFWYSLTSFDLIRLLLSPFAIFGSFLLSFVLL